jgi:hypothetical protein
MSKTVTTTSKANKGNNLHVQTTYNPAGKSFTEAITAAVRQLVSSGEFETAADYNGTRDSNKLNIR